MVEMNVFPGFPLQVFIRQDGFCYTCMAFQETTSCHLYATNTFDFDMAFKLLRNMAKVDVRLCHGVKNVNGKPCSSVILHSWPLPTYRSRKCDAVNITAGKQQCVPCRQVSLYQKVLSKQKKDETPSKKLKRACVNSRCPIAYLTPKTKKKRLRAGTKMRIYYCRKA